MIASILAGVATLALVYARRFEAARYSAALAVATIIAGWALGQWPTILPALTVSQAAAPHDTLVAVVVAVLAAGAMRFPALLLLLRLTLTGRLYGAEAGRQEVAGNRDGLAEPGLLVRVAVACLIIGVGLVNVANAKWAHAVGVASLFAFIVTAFLAIVPRAVATERPSTATHSSEEG